MAEILSEEAWESVKDYAEKYKQRGERIEQLEELAKWLLTCNEFGGWPCSGCPYADYACEDAWMQIANELGIEI